MRPRCLACASCYPPASFKRCTSSAFSPKQSSPRFFSSLLRSTTLIFDSFQRHSFQRQSLKTIFETLLIDNHVILVSNCPHKLVVQGQNMLRIERVLRLPKLNFQNLELTELLTLLIFARFAHFCSVCCTSNTTTSLCCNPPMRPRCPACASCYPGWAGTSSSSSSPPFSSSRLCSFLLSLIDD